MQQNSRSALIFGLFVFAGFSTLGYFLLQSVEQFKALDRTVVVKGLSERQVSADTVIWPIQFQEASNQLGELYNNIQSKSDLVVNYLVEKGIARSEITRSAPGINDLLAQGYSNTAELPFRYTSTTTITVYTKNIDAVLQSINSIIHLGKKGIVISGQNYGVATQYQFSSLNELKPVMVEEATRNARAVAEKFAQDSESRLGKIKSARQGQFSIRDRDANTPQEKIVRVVSTIEYYLSD